MEDDQNGRAVAIYALYLVALFTGVPFLVGVILAYIFRGGTTGPMASHFEHQIGLFWRVVISGIITSVLVATGAVLTGTVLLAIIGIPMMIIGGLGALWVLLMTLTRSIRGIGKANRGEPYPIPAGWSL